MMHRVHRLRVLVPAFLLVLAACTGGGGGGEAGAGGPAPVSLAVSLTDFALHPDRLSAPAGTELTISVTNEGQAPHDLAVDTGAGVKRTPQLQPGDSATLVVPALEPGEYRIFCSIPGHEDLGMVGSLTVSAEHAASATGATGTAGAGAEHGATSEGKVSIEDMLAGHEAGVKAFPAETQGLGNQPLAPRIDGGTKVFELTAQDLRWETEPGVFVEAMGYNGAVPGPEIRVRPGDRVRIVLRNEMAEPTTLHLHGVTVPNGMDGVPYVTQDPIMPGGFFTYEFTVVDPPGFYVYHSHFNAAEQVGKGLYGAFIVEPRGGFSEVYGRSIEVEATMFLGDGPTGYVLNGKGFPATQPIVARRGDDVLIHLSNDGAQVHPMHLHGFDFQVVGQDGRVLDRPYTVDTISLAPGQRFDILVRADEPGVWAFHCHVLPHVEGPHGMFGMVTALVVQE
jgi:FtsP/CotA-like multicopper oxidase with cupredoxin domain